jgi:NAD(P)H-dependent FMN reductase
MLLLPSRAHGAFEIEILDLRDWPLPFFQETIATVGDFANPTYSDPLVKRWNDKIKEADAYLIVTPEYNHSIPALLKNAIDTVFFSYGFRQKPVAFVGYSLGFTAAARAVEHLTQIMVETEAVPVRTPTLVPLVTAAFDEKGPAHQSRPNSNSERHAGRSRMVGQGTADGAERRSTTARCVAHPGTSGRK